MLVVPAKIFFILAGPQRSLDLDEAGGDCCVRPRGVSFVRVPPQLEGIKYIKCNPHTLCGLCSISAQNGYGSSSC